MFAVMKGNKFVSKPGSHSSYCVFPEYARTYETYEQAKRDCCENERVVWLVLGHVSIPTEEQKRGK